MLPTAAHDAFATAAELSEPTANAPEASAPTSNPPASREQSWSAVGTALCVPAWAALCRPIRLAPLGLSQPTRPPYGKEPNTEPGETLRKPAKNCRARKRPARRPPGSHLGVLGVGERLALGGHAKTSSFGWRADTKLWSSVATSSSQCEQAAIPTPYGDNRRLLGGL